MVEYIGEKKKRKGSRGSTAALHTSSAELDSVVFNNRVKIYELATLADFLIRQGEYPRSGGDVLKMSIVMFYEYLIATGKSRIYELQEAKVFCERHGLATGSRRNVRTIGAQLENYTPASSVFTDEEVKLAIEFHKASVEAQEKGIVIEYNEWLDSRSKNIVNDIARESLVSEADLNCPLENECTIPPDDDSLLSELEKGSVNVPIAK